MGGCGFGVMLQIVGRGVISLSAVIISFDFYYDVCVVVVVVVMAVWRERCLWWVL